MNQLRHIPSRVWGLMSIGGAAFLWALGGVVAKVLLMDDVSSLDLVQLRLTIGSLLAFVFLKRFRTNAFQILKSDIPALIAAGLIGLVVNQYAYYKALEKIHVSMAISLEYLAPVFVAIYSGWVCRKRPSNLTTCGLAGAVIGAFLIAKGYRIQWLGLNWVGVSCGLMAAMSLAALTLLMDGLAKRYHVLTTLFYGMLTASLFIDIFHSPFYVLYQISSAQTWFGVIFISTFSTFIPLILYSYAVKFLGPVEASVGLGAEMLFAAILGFYLLGEKLEVAQVFGGGVLICMVTLVQWEMKRVKSALSGLPNHA